MNTFPELLEVREDPQLLGPLLEDAAEGKVEWEIGFHFSHIIVLTGR